MESGDLYGTLAFLKDKVGLSEVYEVTRFLGLRKTQQGVEQKVNVEILDAGPDVDPGLRYHASAFVEGKEASGTTGETLLEAVLNVPWQELDS